MKRRPVIALLWHRAEDETKARRVSIGLRQPEMYEAVLPPTWTKDWRQHGLPR